MRILRFLPLLIVLLPSCLVPLGYTTARAHGWVSDSESAQYLQLSMEYWQKGAAVRQTAADDQALTQGLATLSQEFEAKLDTVIPGTTSSDEIPTGDDTGVPARSMAGVVLKEALKASAAGRSAVSGPPDLEAEYRKVLDSQSGARGLYLEAQSVWPQNMVNYRWASGSNPSASHRAALTAAMADWGTASNGQVSFRELPEDPWTNFQLTIGVLGCVILEDDDLGPAVTGRATVGYQCGSIFGYLKLQADLADPVAVRRTSLHELGHVLGLIHEHKRFDRDEWIDVASGGYSLGEADLGKVDEYVENLRWKPAQVNMGAWSVTVYFPVWWKERLSHAVGRFDLKSVMIYSGFLTRKNWTDPTTGAVLPAGSVVPWNTRLSIGDGAAVRDLYR